MMRECGMWIITKTSSLIAGFLSECRNEKGFKRSLDTVSDASQNSLLLLPQCLYHIELETILGGTYAIRGLLPFTSSYR